MRGVPPRPPLDLVGALREARQAIGAEQRERQVRGLGSSARLLGVLVRLEVVEVELRRSDHAARHGLAVPVVPVDRLGEDAARTFLTTNEVADRLGVSVWTARRWARERRLLAHRVREGRITRWAIDTASQDATPSA